jgi:hypothetical protein
MAESCNIYSSLSKRPVRKLLDKPLYTPLPDMQTVRLCTSKTWVNTQIKVANGNITSFVLMTKWNQQMVRNVLDPTKNSSTSVQTYYRDYLMPIYINLPKYLDLRKRNRILEKITWWRVSYVLFTKQCKGDEKKGAHSTQDGVLKRAGNLLTGWVTVSFSTSIPHRLIQ